MDGSSCTALTERERECLRLVTPGFEEKRIAERLGISHHTVKVHLRSTRSKLRVATSVEAAIMLAAEEGRTWHGTNTTGGMAEPAPDAPDELTGRTGGGAGQTRVVREDTGNATGTFYAPGVTPSMQRRARNAFTVTNRLVAILFMIVFLALAIVAAPALYGSFQEVANRISPP